MTIDQKDNLAALTTAILYGYRVSFRYAKGEDQAIIEPRTLEPTEIVRDGDTVRVIGIDPDRDDYRSYRLDRIKGAVLSVA